MSDDIDRLLDEAPAVETEVVYGWVAEAIHEKGLPTEWVEALRASDGFTEEQKVVFVSHIADAADWKLKRERAVEIGRLSGAMEADARRETGSDREQRIARAMAYAAWEFDGKPKSSEAQRREFGVVKTELTGSLDRILKAVKKKEKG